jgi:hypothetical protein
VDCAVGNLVGLFNIGSSINFVGFIDGAFAVMTFPIIDSELLLVGKNVGIVLGFVLQFLYKRACGCDDGDKKLLKELLLISCIVIAVGSNVGCIVAAEEWYVTGTTGGGTFRGGSTTFSKFG